MRGAREEAQRGICWPGTLCLSAPLSKPRPPVASPQSALSKHHCLMAHCHASTLIQPYVKNGGITCAICLVAWGREQNTCSGCICTAPADPPRFCRPSTRQGRWRPIATGPAHIPKHVWQGWVQHSKPWLEVQGFNHNPWTCGCEHHKERFLEPPIDFPSCALGMLLLHHLLEDATVQNKRMRACS